MPRIQPKNSETEACPAPLLLLPAPAPAPAPLLVLLLLVLLLLPLTLLLPLPGVACPAAPMAERAVELAPVPSCNALLPAAESKLLPAPPAAAVGKPA